MSDNTALVEKIKSLESLAPDERKYLLHLLQDAKRYGLRWENKPEALEQRLLDELPLLEQVSEKALLNGIQTKNGDSLFPEQLPPPPTHLLIEGDNLHALTALTFTHANSVDVIYVDPPYNTGNRDFKYNDRYVDRDDGYRHSTWLSFMHKRLRLARELLKDSGVIFISIDDNEQAQLKLLCDEAFGQENFIANVVWQHSVQPKGYEGKFSVHHNYILIYQNTPEFKLESLERTEAHNKAYIYEDEKGKYRTGDVRNALYRPNLIYDIETPGGKIIKSPKNGWRWSKETMMNMMQTGEVVFNETETNIIKKIYLDNVGGRVPETIWFADEVGTTRDGKKILKEIFGNETPFETVKPVELLQRILQISAGKSALILDFFAGSGTTAHAVMALNAEDGGNRRCILVTNNEANGVEQKLRAEGKSEEEIAEHGICRAVTYPRLRKVIEGYVKPNGGDVPGLKNNRLRYFRTTFAPAEPTLANKQALARQATDLLCIRHDCFDEVETGIPDLRLFARFDERRLMVIYNEDAIPAAVEHIAAAPAPLRFQVYVFSVGHDPYKEEFYDVWERVELLPLPQAILNVYGHVFNRLNLKRQ